MSNKTKVKLGLCYLSQVNIPNFKSISQRMKEKNLTKGSNSCKAMSNATKVKLDLYNPKTNWPTKFQVDFSKDDKEKSAWLILVNFGQTSIN